MNDEVLLRVPAVVARVGLSRTTLYAYAKQGKFPAPIKVGGYAIAWRASEVSAWIAAQGAPAKTAA